MNRLGQSIGWTVLVAAAAFRLLSGNVSAAEGPVSAILEHSRFVSTVPLGTDAAGKRLEFLIPPDMFDGARRDLADLRLIDAADNVVPYAVRVRLPRSTRQPVDARLFNRGSPAEGAAELSLDLGETPLEHNEIEVQTAGDGFRRQAVVEGSADGEAWSKLAEKPLLRFQRAREPFEDALIEYPPSRFRYLRVRVSKDPEVDRLAVEIGVVVVRRTVEIPGEFITHDVKQLGPRRPSRNAGVTGSEWIIDLGGRQVPCQRLEVEIEDGEFVRDYTVSAFGDNANAPPAWDGGYGSAGETYMAGQYRALPRDAATAVTLGEAFTRFSSARGTWRRQAGEKGPLVVELGEVRAGQLKLFVADGANPPLKVTGVRFVAAACVVVLENSPEIRGPLRAYFGHAAAEPPSYDFARNLPDRLDPPPGKIVAAEREENPAFVPPPLPFTERFRWLIHCVLGGVSLLLGALVFQLARRVIARHDARAGAV